MGPGLCGPSTTAAYRCKEQVRNVAEIYANIVAMQLHMMLALSSGIACLCCAFELGIVLGWAGLCISFEWELCWVWAGLRISFEW